MGWGRNERVCSLTVGVWAGDEGSECVEGGAAQCAASVCVRGAAGVVYNEKLSPSFLRERERAREEALLVRLSHLCVGFYCRGNHRRHAIIATPCDAPLPSFMYEASL